MSLISIRAIAMHFEGICGHENRTQLSFKMKTLILACIVLLCQLVLEGELKTFIGHVIWSPLSDNK